MQGYVMAKSSYTCTARAHIALVDINFIMRRFVAQAIMCILLPFRRTTCRDSQLSEIHLYEYDFQIRVFI